MHWFSPLSGNFSLVFAGVYSLVDVYKLCEQVGGLEIFFSSFFSH